MRVGLYPGTFDPITNGHPDTTYLTACDTAKTFSAPALGASSYRWRWRSGGCR